MGKLLTQSQFGRRMKLSRGRISQLVKEEVIHLVDGRIDPVAALKSIQANVNGSRRLGSEGKPKRQHRKKSFSKPGDNGLSLTEVRRDHELIKKELTSLKLEIEKGNLIQKGQSIEWLCTIVAEAKQAFMNFPRRMAPVVFEKTDILDVEVILRKEIYSILDRLADSKNSKEGTAEPRGSPDVQC